MNSLDILSVLLVVMVLSAPAAWLLVERREHAAFVYLGLLVGMMVGVSLVLRVY